MTKANPKSIERLKEAAGAVTSPRGATAIPSANRPGNQYRQSVPAVPAKSSPAIDKPYPIRALIDGKTQTFSTVEEKFEALAENWDEFNVGRSITSFDHPAYHQILAMGEAIIPLLIGRLRQGEDDWIYALKCISGEQAEPAETYGDPDRVIEAWIQWYDGRLG